MGSASNKQIPKSFRANRSRFLQWLEELCQSFFGWKVKGGIEEKHNDKRLVVLIAPHTPNWGMQIFLELLAMDLMQR